MDRAIGIFNRYTVDRKIDIESVSYSKILTEGCLCHPFNFFKMKAFRKALRRFSGFGDKAIVDQGMRTDREAWVLEVKAILALRVYNQFFALEDI